MIYYLINKISKSIITLLIKKKNKRADHHFILILNKLII